MILLLIQSSLLQQQIRTSICLPFPLVLPLVLEHLTKSQALLPMPSLPVHKLSKAHNGFTILELVIATIVASILTGTAVASFFNNYERERMRSGSRVVASWLEDQRKKAIQNSVPCDITMDYPSQQINSLCDFSGAPNETLDLRNELDDERLTIENHSSGSDPNADNATWSFTPRGTSTAEIELRLILNSSEDATVRCIQILSPLGIIRQGRATSRTDQCNFTSAY